jgi:hypothetical protein
MTRSLVRTAALALATTALAAPTAFARPDVTPAAAKPAAHAQGTRHADTDQFATRPVLDRNPTSPSTPSSAPVTLSVTSADQGIDWATIAIGIAGSLLAVGLVAGIAGRTRRAGHPRVIA